MGAVRMRVQTADKNITVIHTSLSMNIFWNEKLHICKTKVHHLGILTLNCPLFMMFPAVTNSVSVVLSHQNPLTCCLELVWTYLGVFLSWFRHLLFHWRKQYGGCSFYVKWCGLLVDLDYCDVFISCLDSHSDGTHSLQRIHWRASDVMLNFSK